MWNPLRALNTEQSVRRMKGKCSAKSNGWRALDLFLIAALLACLSHAPACVTAAECDQSSPCEDDAQVCFEYICRDRCTTDEECAEGTSCVPCEAQDSCYGQSASACVDGSAYEGY